MKCLWAVLALMGASTCALRAELTAAAVLQKMRAKYASSQSYEDSGAVWFRQRAVPDYEALRFQTWYVRPESYRFEWTATIDVPETGWGGKEKIRHLHEHSFIGWNSRGAFECFDPGIYGRHLDVGGYRFKFAPGGEQREAALGSAVARAQGVSLRSVSTISSLVMTGYSFTYRFPELKHVHLLASGRFEATDCYRVAGLHLGERVEVWIGKRDFLIRKIRWGSGADLVETMRSHPRVNIPIAPEVFQQANPRTLRSRAR